MPFARQALTSTFSWGFGGNGLLIPIALGAIAGAYLARAVQRRGGWDFLVRLLLQGYESGPRQRGPGAQGRTAQQRPERATLDEVCRWKRRLPAAAQMLLHSRAWCVARLPASLWFAAYCEAGQAAPFLPLHLLPYPGHNGAGPAAHGALPQPRAAQGADRSRAQGACSQG